MGRDPEPRPWIRVVPESEAAGLLAAHYEAAVKRAGKVFQIVKIMSLRPEALAASLGLYRTLMFGASGLTRAEREFVAVVVSFANHCHY